MKYVIIPIIKFALLLYAIAIVTPLFLLVFITVLGWTFDLQLALSLKVLPWQKQRIEYFSFGDHSICWHEAPYATDIEYPTFYHQMLGLNPTFIPVPDPYEGIEKTMD